MTAQEKIVATMFDQYLLTRGWTRATALPVGAVKADLSLLTKVNVELPAVVRKLVSLYASRDLLQAYVKVEGAGIYTKKLGKALTDLPGAVVDSGKAEEVGAKVQRNMTWVIVGVGAALALVVGAIFWKRSK